MRLLILALASASLISAEVGEVNNDQEFVEAFGITIKGNGTQNGYMDHQDTIVDYEQTGRKNVTFSNGKNYTAVDPPKGMISGFHPAEGGVTERGMLINTTWGQYAPFYNATYVFNNNKMAPLDAVPETCKLTQVNLLMRHGSRNPTANARERLLRTYDKFPKITKYLNPHLEFLKNENDLILGADSLVDKGRVEAKEVGHWHSFMFRELGPYRVMVRSSSSQRVVESAQLFKEGLFDFINPGSYLENFLVISEDGQQNNTIDNSRCPNFEGNSARSKASKAKWVGPLVRRINTWIRPHNLFTEDDAQNLAELCIFYTLYQNTLSDFCQLINEDDWPKIEQTYDLDKMEAHYEAPLSAVQGIGWWQELAARLTGDRKYAVLPWSNVDHNLNNDPKTFPLDTNFNADFTHDNQMLPIFAAVDLFKHLPFHASAIVPFSSQFRVEKWSCSGEPDESIRLSLNDFILPMNILCPSVGQNSTLCPLPEFLSKLPLGNATHWTEKIKECGAN